jgi:dihydroxy-acid dehydratase
VSIWPNWSLETTEGGTIALVKDDDTIIIDIQNNSLEPEVTPEALHRIHANLHKKFGKHWVVAHSRQRTISKALQAYAHFATSASEVAMSKI